MLYVLWFIYMIWLLIQFYLHPAVWQCYRARRRFPFRLQFSILFWHWESAEYSWLMFCQWGIIRRAFPIFDRRRSRLIIAYVRRGSFGRFGFVSSAISGKEFLVYVQCAIGGSNQCFVLGSSSGRLHYIYISWYGVANDRSFASDWWWFSDSSGSLYSLGSRSQSPCSSCDRLVDWSAPSLAAVEHYHSPGIWFVWDSCSSLLVLGGTMFPT